ncbi:MAG: molybdopterin-dependent oxidoreductase, partial [Firmicutes bacterium]|nr:molybdopterin-dependent oxidoreductase [Bacillota bacterium]
MAVQEKWVPSTCKMCLHGCGIRVKVRDGVVVKIEGDPTNQNNLGKLCPKGNSGIMRLYDPQRVKSPLRRTNPVKGSGVDPGWEPISWDEALTTVAEKLGRIRREDPRKLLCAFGDFQRPWLKGWPSAFGAHSYFTCVSQYCGAAYHPFCGIVDGSFAATNDFEHCNYWIQFGSGAGFSSHLHLTGSNKRMADARRRGMKLVVVEPRLSEGGSKANEWIPIRPGTDRAFALGMMNVLLHELDLYDAEFIKKQTNGPYLIGEDGYTVRGAEGKAMVWDPADACAKPHDDPGIKDFA